MEWEYKQVKISIDSDGLFYFKIDGAFYKQKTLEDAKKSIDEFSKSYYNFTQKDMDKLMSKLDKRERDLVRSLYKEIECHANSPYCEMGIIDNEWNWDWDFSNKYNV